MSQWGLGGGQMPPAGDPFGGQPFGFPPGQQPHVWAPPPATPNSVNTFATLSVVFALIVAPAGAIFGHLGLNQIRRTGQLGRNRAIIGLTLSYTMIAVLSVALVLWLIWPNPTQTSANTPPDSAAGATATATKDEPSPAQPCGNRPERTPDFAAGKNHDPSALAGLLLGPEEIKRALLSKKFQDLTAEPAQYEPLSSTERFGSVAPARCAIELFAGTADAFQNTGYSGFALVTTVDTTGTLVVLQAAASYPDQTTAHKRITEYAARFGTDKRLTITFTPSSGGPPVTGSPFAERWGSFLNTRTYNEGEDLTADRTLFQKGNVIIDISVLGNTGSYGIGIGIEKRMR